MAKPRRFFLKLSEAGGGVFGVCQKPQVSKALALLNSIYNLWKQHTKKRKQHVVFLERHIPNIT